MPEPTPYAPHAHEAPALALPETGALKVYAPVPVLPAEHARYQPLLERMMAKEPDARARSAAELREDLARMGLRRQ